MALDPYTNEYEVTLPSSSYLAEQYKEASFADAYAILLPDNASHDPEVIARFLFSQSGFLGTSLMAIRDFIVGWFGLKTAKALNDADPEEKSQRVSLFKIYHILPHEIILGEDDKHLDFRISVLLQPKMVAEKEVTELSLTTVVQCHNLLGRTYIKVIKPFHCQIVRSYLQKSAQRGWPLH